jgi:hypothetical protein
MKNSKIMKKITLGSATVLSAFTLATAVAPTFTTTVHADDVVQQQDQPVLDKIVDTPAFKVQETNCYDSTKVTPDQIQGYQQDPGLIKQNPGEDYTVPEGYEEDPTVKGGYVNHDDGIFIPSSIAIRFYRPITTPAPSQNQDTPSAPTTDTPAPSQNQDTPSAPTTDTPAPSQNQDTPSAPTTDTPAPSQNQDTPSAPTTDTPAPSQNQDTPSAPTTDTPAPSQNQDTPSAPTTDTPAPSQNQDTPSAPTTDTPAPSQNQDTPSAPTTDTPASTVEKTEEEAPTAPTAENVTPTSTPKEEKVADTNAKASTTQETSKEGTLPKAGDASLLSMLLGSTLLGSVSMKRFGKKNK